MVTIRAKRGVMMKVNQLSVASIRAGIKACRSWGPSHAKRHLKMLTRATLKSIPEGSQERTELLREIGEAALATRNNDLYEEMLQQELVAA